MIAVQTRMMVLPVVAALWTSIGCEPAVQPVAKAPEIAQPVGTKPSANGVHRTIKADENSLLARLLTSETVQQDLGLTSVQMEKLNDLLKISAERSREFTAERRKVFPAGRFSQEEGQEQSRKLHEFLDDWKTKIGELRTNCLAILTPSQLERLKQIRLQVAIVATLEKPENIKALDISPQEREKIRALSDQLTAKLTAGFPNLRGLSLDQRRRKLIEFSEQSDKASAENRKRVLEVLTREQRTKFEQMGGKQIEPKWSYESMFPADIGDWYPN